MRPAKLYRTIFTLLVKLFGTTLVDHRTGEKVAKAFMICWRGRIYLFGLQGKDQVIPMFLPQERLSFWKREIGFTTHPPPDFPREPRTESSR